MIECHDRARFLLKPPQALRIAGKARGQEFERGLAARCKVSGQIDFAHPAGADSLGKFVVADRLTYEQIRLRIFNNPRRETNRGSFNEAAGSLMRSEQRFDFTAQQLITFAGRVEECANLVRLSIERGMKDFLNQL